MMLANQIVSDYLGHRLGETIHRRLVEQGVPVCKVCILPSTHDFHPDYSVSVTLHGLVNAPVRRIVSSLGMGPWTNIAHAQAFKSIVDNCISTLVSIYQHSEARKH